MKRICIKVLSLITIFILLTNTAVLATANIEQQRVRVGWFTLDGVQYIEKDGTRRGYCYDYYQEIKKYANFSYDYVHGSWQECLDWLKNGDIDMLSFIQYSEERSEYLDFTSTQIGQNYAVLSTRVDNDIINANDYSTFDGKTVGAIRGSKQQIDLEQLMQENGFRCNVIEYDELEDVVNALDDKEIDMMLYHSIRELPNNERVVAQFAPERIYIAVKKGNTELLTKLDKAIENIKIYDPDLNSRLLNTYFAGNSSRQLVLTREERIYLDGLKKVDILLPPGKGYLAYEEDGMYGGIYHDILDEIFDSLEIEREYHKVDTYANMSAAAKESDCVVQCGFFYDYSWAELKDVYITAPVMTLQYYRIQNQKRLNKSEHILKVAATKGLKFNQEYVLENYTEDQITWYDTVEECLNAVQSGEQDVTFCSTYTAEYYMKDYHYNKLTASLISHKNDICFATPKSMGPMLSTILSKAVSNLGNERINGIVFENITRPYEGNTFERLIYTNPIECIVLICIFVSIFIFILGLVYLNKVSIKKNVALREVSKAKSDFLSNMSHEIRTPLNGIKGMLELLKQRPELENDSHLDNAIVSVNHLTSLINDILDMSKIESSTFSLKPELTAFEDIYEYIDAMVKPFADEKNISFTSNIQPCKFRYLYVDAGRLKQVMINLLTNAIKYTNNGGSVHYNIEVNELETNSVLLNFTVSDTGIGMSREFIKKAFEPFEQEERSRINQGTGLGLAITKSLVDVMGGKINIKSEVGKGTEISVTLKVFGANASDLEGEEKHVYSAVNNFDNVNLLGKRALVAEDNEINMEIARIQLGALGLTIETAFDGEETVEKFKESEEGYYDIIFMDIMMPKKNGLEATKEIRALERSDAKEVPIVAMTANAFVEDVHKSLENGMNYHLSKPFEVSQMKEILAREFSKQ